MKLLLAPMEGVVDYVTRDLISDLGGLDFCVTEFLRITDQLLPPKVFHRLCPELRMGGRTPAGTPVFFQLLGGKPEWVAENAVRAVNLGAYGIDLNFGCPAKTVNRHDGGATLLKNPERIHSMVRAVRQAVPDGAPVTAKIRLGYEHKAYALELALAAQEAGAEWLTVHARTKLEAYRPPAHWEYIALARENLEIPVIANGDIWSIEDFQRCREITGCDHFMLGRGLIASPSLARQIRNGTPLLSWDELKRLIHKFYLRSLDFRHDRYAIQRLKQWSKLLGRNYPEALEVFEAIKRLESEVDIRTALTALLGTPPATHQDTSPRTSQGATLTPAEHKQVSA